LSLEQIGHQLKLEIADNGIGISNTKAPIYLWDGFGLRSMQPRTHQLKDHFCFHSKPDAGTRLTVCLPLI